MDNETTAQLNFIMQVIERHGCRLVDVDFDTYRIDIEGPEDRKAACARALMEALGG